MSKTRIPVAPKTIVTRLIKMQQKDKTDPHMAICKELNQVYKAKNADYGDSFKKVWESAGIMSAYARLADKFYRFESLALKNQIPQIKQESIRDTLLDMANYCIMTAMEISREKPKCPHYEDCREDNICMLCKWSVLDDNDALSCVLDGEGTFEYPHKNKEVF